MSSKHATRDYRDSRISCRGRADGATPGPASVQLPADGGSVVAALERRNPAGLLELDTQLVGGLAYRQWSMGWMHDTLDCISRDPVHRRWDHGQR